MAARRSREDKPRFGTGSRSCAGSENLCAAMSETPINLRRMLRKALSFEPSSGVLSMVALGCERVGVEVPDLSADGCREDCVELVSAMVYWTRWSRSALWELFHWRWGMVVFACALAISGIKTSSSFAPSCG